MFFKIKRNILYRQYDEYGYITDNSMFGYGIVGKISSSNNEKFVSKSGSIMLEVLNRTPRHIDDIVKELLTIFVGVEFDELKRDSTAFYTALADAGFLDCGDTFEQCQDGVTSFAARETTLNTVESSNKCLMSKSFTACDFLRSIHIEITRKCNERCIHCYIPHNRKDKTMAPELFYRIISEGRAMNIVNVTLSGGEPLLHENILDFLAKCREMDLSVNILTNLTLLTDEILEEMKKNPLLSVQTSLYSLEPSIHDAITQQPGSLEKTMNNLKKIHSADIPLQISCPIMKQNKDSFVDVIAWGEQNNIQTVIEYIIFSTYDHSCKNIKNRLSYEEIVDAFNKRITSEYINTLYRTAKEKENLAECAPICSVGRYDFCISAEGDAFPCAGWQNCKLGNLYTSSVKEIWENSSKLNSLRRVNRKHFFSCRKCKDRGYCTVCMMANSNDSQDENPFFINELRCRVAAFIHQKVESLIQDRLTSLKEI